jgi:hypothetical protein
MPTRTFISYNREDHQLAIKLSNQIRLPASRDIETSVDTESLSPGLLFSPALSRFVVLADWFILLYTQGNKRYEYSMFEAGQYFNSHHMDSTTPPPETKTLGRFCCLYDTPEMPEVFRQHQNYQVFTFNSETGKSFRRMHNDIRTEDEFLRSSSAPKIFTGILRQSFE